jgi:hypothetical protein
MTAHTRTSQSTHAVTVAGYETVAFFEGAAAAQSYALWAHKVGYSPWTEGIDR